MTPFALTLVLIAAGLHATGPYCAKSAGGGLVIVTSIFFLADGARMFHESRAHLRTAMNYGLISGGWIAAYTLWDRQGVHARGIAPVLYDGGTAFCVLAFVTPFALPRWP